MEDEPFQTYYIILRIWTNPPPFWYTWVVEARLISEEFISGAFPWTLGGITVCEILVHEQYQDPPL